MPARINTEKAEANYEKSNHQKFIDGLEDKTITDTVEEMIAEADAKFGINKAVLARVLAVSRGTIQNWEDANSRKELVFWALKGLKQSYRTFFYTVKFGFDD
jgi:DNA-binding transcriptional regulator YiaG